MLRANRHRPDNQRRLATRWAASPTRELVGSEGHRVSRRWSVVSLAVLVVCLLFAGCARNSTTATTDHADAARVQFERTTQTYNNTPLPAGKQERIRFLESVATGYTQLLHRYPDQPQWCAQALRSLGNVRAAEGRITDAVKIYERVGNEYPSDRWQVLQAWKSAADLLRENNQHAEAQVFYRKIIERFGDSDAPQLTRLIVAAAKSRAGGASHPVAAGTRLLQIN